MKNPSRSRIEQETTVTFNQAEDFALVWTCSPVHLRKFCRLGYEMIRNDGEGRMFSVPKTLISFRKPVKRKEISEHHRRMASESLKRARQAKTLVKS